MVNEEQSTAPVAGRLVTNTEDLRSFGQKIAAHGETVEGLSLAGLAGGLNMAGSAVARALADAAEACDGALVRVHQDYAFAGDESARDSSRFEEHEQQHAAAMRAVGEQIR